MDQEVQFKKENNFKMAFKGCSNCKHFRFTHDPNKPSYECHSLGEDKPLEVHLTSTCDKWKFFQDNL